MSKYSHILAWVLLLVYSLWVLRAMVPVAYFYANQKSIVATLCENKTKPALSCNGKCYLKKQISQAEKGTSKTQNKMEVKVWAEEIAHPNSVFLFSDFKLLYTSIFSCLDGEILKDFTSISLPPPKL